MSKNNYQIVEGTFSSNASDGAHLYYKHYISPIDNKASVLHLFFQHGMIEYHKRHEEFFEFLISQYQYNFILSTMDLYGHGLSGGTRADIEKYEVYLSDMKKFIELTTKELHHEDHDYNCVLMAHSLGGLITLKTLESYQKDLPIDISRIILVNPCISPKIEIPKSLEKHVHDAIPEVVKNIQLPLIYGGADLTSDHKKANEFVLDPLISKSISLRLGAETMRATKGIHSLSYFMNIPTLFLLSGDDRVVSLEKAKLFITGMDKSLVESIFYPQARHELLNETCRSEVFQEIITYLKKIRN